MLVITISGQAQHGKDTTARILKRRLEEEDKKVLITHYADVLKFICSNYFGWNGKKDEVGRCLLQRVGTDIVRTKDPDYWVNFMKSILSFFPDEWDVVIIPDTRFPNEILSMKESFDVFSVHVDRGAYENGLTEEQKNHPSERALDGYEFNYDIRNDADIYHLDEEVQKLIRVLKIVGRLKDEQTHIIRRL